MELNVFMRELESALVQRGIPDETALRHVSNLRRTFTNEDLSEIQAIQSSAEINQLADSIAAILNKNRRTAPAPEVLPPENEPDAPLPAAPSAKIQPAPQTSVRPADEIPYDGPAPEPPPRRQQPARSDSRSSASPRRLADETITMMAPKPGLDASECGRVRIAPLAYIEPLLS